MCTCYSPVLYLYPNLSKLFYKCVKSKTKLKNKNSYDKKEPMSVNSK